MGISVVRCSKYMWHTLLIIGLKLCNIYVAIAAFVSQYLHTAYTESIYGLIIIFLLQCNPQHRRQVKNQYKNAIYLLLYDKMNKYFN